MPRAFPVTGARPEDHVNLLVLLVPLKGVHCLAQMEALPSLADCVPQLLMHHLRTRVGRQLQLPLACQRAW